ncbi:MAG: peroxiredoxin [Deltaproteobacteria bacterium]|nr:peroxiredoxin [Deltaproteobacteria bacterium]
MRSPGEGRGEVSERPLEDARAPGTRVEPTAAEHEGVAAVPAVAVGGLAPDFTLEDQDGRPVTLSALRGGWVVLYFYPKDATPGCTTEATEFSGLVGELERMSAKVFGVSADAVGSHAEFIAKFGLGVDLLSDPGREVMKTYGAWLATPFDPQRAGRVIRSTVLIDPAGVIRYRWPEVAPQGHAAAVREKLAELQGGAG